MPYPYPQTTDSPRPAPDAPLRTRLQWLQLQAAALEVGTLFDAFRLEVEETAKLGTSNVLRMSLQQYFRDGGFRDNLVAIVQSPFVQSKGIISALLTGGYLLDSLFLPAVVLELKAELKALCEVLSMRHGDITPEQLKNFDFKHLDELVEKHAPRLRGLMKEIITSRNRYERDTRELGPDHRDRDFILAFAICMVAFARTRYACYLQVIMAYFCLATKVPKRAHQVFSHIGICSSYSSLMRIARRISECVADEYRMKVKQEICMYVWDNLHRLFDVKTRLLTHTAHLSAETQAFLIFLPESVDRTHLPMSSIDHSKAMRLTSLNLLPDFDYLRSIAKAKLFDILWRMLPDVMKKVSSAAPGDGRRPVRPTVAPIHPLPPGRTTIYPLPTMNIDEGRIDETINVIKGIEREICVDGKWYVDNKYAQFGGGDLASVRNCQRAQYQRIECREESERLSYIVPVPGHFHTRIAALRLLFGNFYSDKDGKDYASIYHFKSLVSDNKVDKQCKNFRQSERLLFDIVSGHGMSMFYWLSSTKDKATLSEWLLNGGDWNGMLDFAANNLLDPTAMQRLRFDDEGKKIKRAAPLAFGNVPTGADSHGSNSTGSRDIPLENGILLLRDGLMYKELVDCCKYTDAGRYEKILKYFCVLFQSSGQFNYAAETVNLIANIEHIWDARALSVWRNTVFVNPSGIEGRGQAKDYHNELINRDVKGMTRFTTNQVGDDFNRTHLVRQLPLMSAVRDKVADSCRAVKPNNDNKTVNTDEHVWIFANEMHSVGVFTNEGEGREFCRGRDTKLLYEAKDLLHDGLAKIATTDVVKRFKKSARCNWMGEGTFVETSEEGDRDAEEDDEGLETVEEEEMFDDDDAGY